MCFIFPLISVLNYFQNKSGQRVLISAHGNSLRGLIKYLDNVSDNEIVGLNLPTGEKQQFDIILLLYLIFACVTCSVVINSEIWVTVTVWTCVCLWFIYLFFFFLLSLSLYVCIATIFQCRFMCLWRIKVCFSS